ncbi:MAG: hypothetical protein KAH38_01140 [Candidatus Hydrogenedentes bacterium]|nr:hypothetical protein [Candidatus Hydrogenedentota bacterium]
MDLSGLKWPIIIVVVVGIGFLATSPGINYMVTKFTTAVPGQDVERDKIDEMGLTRVGGYLLYLFKYQKAKAVMQMSIDRYGPGGANYWYNKYRIVRCLEKMKQYEVAHSVLQELVTNDAKQYDKRVPNNDNLRMRASKLKAVHGF